MPETQRKLIVLKFGGSVLLDENRLRIAVHEIYRWRRDGWNVLAVVSALSGRTEELIERCRRLHPSSSPASKAGAIALGERESASLLGIHLDRAGIPACIFTPDSVSLLAVGDPLDAHPVSIDRDVLKNALDTEGIVVFPGFVGINESGETVILGRGGSDLTAIFLAHQLGATKCRLIKDVDALYESDPARCTPPPARFGYANYEDALATDGSIIQHKAVSYAQQHGIEFELGRFNSTRPTLIGPGISMFEDTPDVPEPLNVALCGLGVVGEGVAELLLQLPEHFHIVGAARKTVGSLDSERPYPVYADSIRLALQGADIVVELIGGVTTAREIAEGALFTGSHLVSANKALIAECGAELRDIAAAHSARLMYSASVGGAVPVLESIKQREVTHVDGILNGTANFILGQLAQDRSLQDSILDAQTRGFAEADPTRDLDGRDALDKLRVIAGELSWDVDEHDVARQSIPDWLSGGTAAHPARQIARLTPNKASVLIEHVDSDSVFGTTHNEWNVAVLYLPNGAVIVLRGKGAGRWPTSESVVADLLELSRECVKSTQKEELNAV